MHPTQIKLYESTKLLLKWEDNSESSVTLEKLRKFCPCAICMTERENRSTSYIPVFYSSQIKISKINRVGKYAISIHWEDGHSTGIYEFTFLKNLS